MPVLSLMKSPLWILQLWLFSLYCVPPGSIQFSDNVSSIKIVRHVWPDAVDPQRGHRWTYLPQWKKFNREQGITEHKVKITSPRSDRAWALGHECRVHECFLFRQTDDRGNTRHVLHHHTSNRLRHTAKEPLQIPKVWLWFTWEWN